MTRLHNDPDAFAQEALEGFAAAHADRVRAVPGGVVRRGGPTAGRVAVVIGGGSGHYPAFTGLVGRGLAHGAAVGEVFASPSAHRVQQVARAANGGAGVLLAHGNYAGDVLHFGEAAQRLSAEGIEARTLAVTDDVASGPPHEAHRRRGVAGDLVVFKAAAAAAESGAPLAEVARIAGHANARTRTFGLAFSGCTLPGAADPLFQVPDGRMAVGLGIHGEPGIAEEAAPTADAAAERLVDRLLAELPDGVENAAGQRVGLLLNGLGALTHDELFIVYRRVAQLLAAADVEVVDPEVGELCTSFDMAGLSLTLVWLDAELEALWRAPVDAPALRRGSLSTPPTEGADNGNQAAVTDTVSDVRAPIPLATQDSRRLAGRVVDTLDDIARALDEHADELGRIDAVAGDGDHGIGMRHGSAGALAAARDALAAGAGAGTVLAEAADGWSDRAGGTSGALWGVILRALGAALGDTERATPTTVAAGATDAAEAVMRLGGAAVGDKTMVDALVPFADTLRVAAERGEPLTVAWPQAATAATEAAARTADLLPRAGRARTHAGNSLGTPDAGAHSLGLIVRTVQQRLFLPAQTPAEH
ncbi:dihydroxyacetone kinase family protein [Streptomyces sp. NPDC102467]|uniref:dihydroxyacetone kinase family protein n=1 Tax=Streptomyces sp. NPDC102467 TaxID=3366179 RepID=UPI0037F67D9E